MSLVTELSNKIGVSKNTIYKHLRKKSIRAKRHPLSRRWMISESEIRRLQKEIAEDE